MPIGMGNRPVTTAVRSCCLGPFRPQPHMMEQAAVVPPTSCQPLWAFDLGLASGGFGSPGGEGSGFRCICTILKNQAYLCNVVVINDSEIPEGSCSDQ